MARLMKRKVLVSERGEAYVALKSMSQRAQQRRCLDVSIGNSLGLDRVIQPWVSLIASSRSKGVSLFTFQQHRQIWD